MGDGLLMVEFGLLSDKLRMVRDSPWNFDENLILVKKFVCLQQIQEIKMVEASFWIRVYDLPPLALNEYIGNLVGHSLGRVEEIDMVLGEVVWG